MLVRVSPRHVTYWVWDRNPGHTRGLCVGLLSPLCQDITHLGPMWRKWLSSEARPALSYLYMTRVCTSLLTVKHLRTTSSLSSHMLKVIGAWNSGVGDPHPHPWPWSVAWIAPRSGAEAPQQFLVFLFVTRQLLAQLSTGTLISPPGWVIRTGSSPWQ